LLALAAMLAEGFDSYVTKPCPLLPLKETRQRKFPHSKANLLRLSEAEERFYFFLLSV